MADNKTIQKVFGLSDYRKQALAGNIPERTRETFREYGYYSMGGPFGNPGFTNVYRLDFTNDTNVLNIHNYLNVRHTLAAATGNSNFGYFGGGNGLSSVERIDYANDVTSATFRGPLSLIRGRLAATGNSNFGYFAGGNISVPSTNTSIIDRINYSNDLATATIRGPLSSARQSVGAAFSNSKYGYFTGGALVIYYVPAFSTIDRIDYSNDIVLPSIRGPLSSARRYAAGIGNLNYGYSGGGRNSPSNGISLVDRIDYSNDTAQSSPRGNLVQERTNPGATGNSNYAWFIGGFRSIIDRVDYANDTITSTSRGRLDRDLYGGQATSSHSFGGTPNSSYASNFTFPTVPNAGYFGGGWDGTNNLASIDKVDYANDTATASVRSALSVERRNLAATGNSNFGYFGGGQNTPQLSIVDRIEYSSDTQSAVVRGPINSISIALAATGNSNFGYFGGGNPGLSTVDRIDYSNDTATASVRGPLSQERRLLSATGNSNFGYFGGGLVPGSVSTVDRIDYSNDTQTASARGPLSQSKYNLKATGNSNFGYFGGGTGGGSIVDRIDYSNDTATASVRGSLSQERASHAATGNSNFGYFGGGSSIVDRINYSNDTAIASVRGPLPVAKSLLAATSPLAYGGAPIYFTNPLPQVFQDQIEFDDSNTLDLPFKRVLGSYGYYAGSQGVYSKIDRLDFANDTDTSSFRGDLSVGTGQLAASFSNNYGYYAGGYPVPSPPISTIQRQDFSNDTALTIRRAGLTIAISQHRGTGNKNYGYFGAGYNAQSRINRIDYSNDNVNAQRVSSISFGRNQLAATSNKNYGYFAGGRIVGSPTSVHTTIDRIDFSNDNAVASVRGPLSRGRFQIGGVSNNDYAWFAGGAPGASVVDRVDYSNDTTITSVRTNLSTDVGDATGTYYNTNYGYFRDQKLNLSNDTIASTTTNLVTSRSLYAGVTNASNA